MYISRLITDLWVGGSDRGQELTEFSWEDIEAAIRGLDGHQRTAVFLLRTEDAYLSVGGGNDGNYLVFATEDNAHFMHVRMPGYLHVAKDVTVILSPGGQASDWPIRELVDLDTALRAARAYATAGILDPALTWIPQETIQ